MNKKENSKDFLVEPYQDSVFVGTPKDGGLKVYGDTNDPIAFAKKIRNAVVLLEFAKQELKNPKDEVEL